MMNYKYCTAIFSYESGMMVLYNRSNLEIPAFLRFTLFLLRAVHIFIGGCPPSYVPIGANLFLCPKDLSLYSLADK